MAKSPVKNPPVSQVDAGETSAPSIVVESIENKLAASSSEAVPTLVPPASSSDTTEDAFGAGTWINDKRISALFSTNETRNSWINVVGIGWVKLANSIDSANEALTVLATTAKVKNSPVNYLLDGGLITQMYVW